MKISKTLITLSSLIALLAALYAALGVFWLGDGAPSAFTSLRGQQVELFGRGVYRFDTTFFASGFRGADLITLFLAAPLMIAAIARYRRGSLRAALVLIASLVYMLYNGLSLAIGAAYNPLFLVYTAIFSASLFALGIAWAQINFATLPKTPRRGAAIFLFIGGIVTALLWLSDLLPPLLQGGNPPALLGPYTTPTTYFIDLGLITPACLLAGRWLLRGDPRGTVAGFALLYLLALMGCIVLSQTIFQINAGVAFSPAQLGAMIGSWIVMGAIAVGMVVSILRDLREGKR
jgi:hypothetical protein